MSYADIIFTHIKDGQFMSRKARQLITALEGQDVEFELRKRRRHATQPQRGYYFGHIVYEFGECWRGLGVTGQYGGPITDDEVHEMLKVKMLVVSVYSPESGEIVGSRVRSTKELTVSEMSDYIQSLIEYGSTEYHIKFKEAGQQTEIETP